ncbi:nucleoside triphosphate pyrophosphohydrolase [Halorubrum ezzemoulense]|uniref:nucleoside triphosphate pyrophosphohydrolase n=1 Tax=Halorubrum ezzemoulense TaxID=337243 RepID=UPI000A8EA373|nr:nucleoside triphosphate pyrophosphohydrolase [Halorubrum ezzemoulense]
MEEPIRSYDEGNDKLVRDNIPAVIEENGEEPTIHVADEVEYADRLVEKLEEEVIEYRESRDLDELADILEVVHAIRTERGLTVEELREIRTRKAEQRGRFDDGIVLECVEK